MTERNKASDMDIEALVDGELDEETSRNLLRKFALDPERMQHYRKLLEQKKTLQDWWRNDNRDH